MTSKRISYRFQTEGVEMIEGFGGRALLADSMGLGKAQPLDAKIMTPTGWTTMGKLSIGDLVFGADGKPIKVTAIHPQGLKKVYRIRFSDRSSVESTKDHLWAVNTPQRRWSKKPPQAKTLGEIMEKGLTDKYGNKLHFIPLLSAPAQFTERPIPLDPYLLGYLIANGCLKNSVDVSIPDSEMVERLKTLLPPELKLKYRGNITYAIVQKKKRGGAGTNSVRNAIKDLGLFGKGAHQKHIPEIYLYNSVGIRTRLLQGLMDGDGYISANSNNLEYGTTSKILALQMKELVQSLGGTCFITKSWPTFVHKGIKKTGRRYYRHSIALPNEIQPFLLSRKLNRYRPRTKYFPRRSISQIIYAGKKECRCIEVDSPDGLYATDNYILTHNSRQALLWVQKHPEARPVIIVCPASLKWNWEHECKVNIGERSEILEGRKPRKWGLSRCKILIINYDILADWLPQLLELKPQILIADEIHYCQGRTTQRTKAMKVLARAIPYIIGLSGTPLINRPAELWPGLNMIRPDLFPSFWTFARQFCLPADAPILMANLKEKPINEVQISDYVIGWSKPGKRRRRLVKSKVLDILTKEAPLQKITLENGTEVISTPDHLWANGRSKGKGEDFEFQQARTGLLTGRGRRGFASRIMEVFRGTKPLYPQNKDYMHGYIHGFFRGDGHCVKSQKFKYHPFKRETRIMNPTYDVGCACKDEAPIRRISRFLKICGQHHTKIIRSDGLHSIGRLANRRGYKFISKTTKERDSDAWWAGFLGGIYDAEGCGNTIGQDKIINRINRTIIKRALRRFQFRFSIFPKTFTMLGGRTSLLRFWNIAAPTLRRKLIKYVLSAGGKFNAGGVGKGTPPSYVVKIEPLPGIHTTYTLTTETGNYIAYGCGSKNCKMRRTPWGWDTSGASNVETLNSTLTSTLMVRRRTEDVLSELPAMRRIVVPLDIDNRKEYEKAVDNFLGWLAEHKPGKLHSAAKAQGLVQLSYLKRLAAEGKLPNVTEWLDNYFKQTDDKLILFAFHKKIISLLHERYSKISVVVDGSVIGKKRQRAIDQFINGKKTQLFIGNFKAAGVGWSGKGVPNVAWAEFPWAPGTVTQGEKRAHGIGRGKEGVHTTIFFLVGRETIEERLVKIIQKKQEVSNSILDGEGKGDDLNIYDQLIQELRKGKSK